MRPLLFICMLFAFTSCTPVPGTTVPVPATRTTDSPTSAVATLPPTITVAAMPVSTAISTLTATPANTPLPATRFPYIRPTRFNVPTPTAVVRAECQRPADHPTDIPWYACTEPKTSPDGQWVVSFLGGDWCGSGLGILNVATDELKKEETFNSRVHWFEFLSDGRLLLGAGACSGEDVYTYDLRDEQALRLGIGSLRPPRFNEMQTAFIVNVPGYVWEWFRVWAYNAETDHLFFSTEETLGPAYWTPDGLSLVYQHVTKNYEDRGFTIGPGAIHVVDIISGEELPLASDPHYSYYFCTFGDCVLDEEWLRVWRIPYTPYLFNYENSADYDYEVDKEAVECALDVDDCDAPIEDFWLNRHTGELLPYEQMPGVPTLTTVPLPPELDTP